MISSKIRRDRKYKTIIRILFLSFIMVGIVVNLNLEFSFTIIIVMFAFFIHHFFRGPYWVLEDRYVTNFTNANIRTKILSTSNLLKNIAKIGINFLGGLLLEFYTTATSYFIIGCVGFIVILPVLRYMKRKNRVKS